MGHILQHIGPHTTLLTPNRRLSATLHKLYKMYQLKQHSCWQTPDILPLSSWIRRLWRDYCSKTFLKTPHLLNATQEHFLWENILLQSTASEQLLQLAETAEMTRSAWGLLKQWRVDIHQPIFKSTDDYMALHEWASHFQASCEKNNWMDLNTLPDAIGQQMNLIAELLPKQILLVGFTEISPQLKHFLTACEQTGSKVNLAERPSSQADCYRIRLPDEENEILSMARWAKSLLEKDKSVSIGCVIPSLDKIRDRVMQLFSEVFADENTYTLDPQRYPFNLSAGKRLSHYPIISTALQLLSLHKHNVPIDIMSHLLSSPFLGEAEKERMKRAHFDSLLRQANVININLRVSVQDTDNKTSLSLNKKCPHLAKRLREFISATDEHQHTFTYSKWASLICDYLNLLGWPGERSLNSEEYQVMESWLILLNEFTTLDYVAPPVHFQQALHTLQKMVSKTIFQPKSPEAPIQVLGMLEAASLPFDYLWIMGMDDLSWPPQPKPNPFIPKRLQRELHMPHATAERELLFCHSLIQQFKQSAKHIIFSHAEKCEELELQPSSLIREMTEMDSKHLSLASYQTPSKKIYAAKELEYLIDDVAPPITANEIIHGGVNVIKQQALCPFKAFSEWRLHAHQLESPLPGLRAKDRGTVIHKALEILWNHLHDHSTLLSAQDDKLNELIHTCIASALLLIPHSHNATMQYMSLEKQRLHKLIWDWLQCEKERSSFKVVTSEKSSQITLNQLSLSIRIDRIDELPDGKKLIIDYKTGKHNHINHWFSERPEDPQLPLYSLIDTDKTTGITFAQLYPGEHVFKGISRYALEIKGIKLISELKQTTALSWDEQQNQWRTVLTNLSDAFYSGHAQVDPKDPKTTCTWCALQPLCRINDEVNIR